jgi:hypothetical protein
MTNDLAQHDEETRFFSLPNLASWLLTGAVLGVVVVFFALGPEQTIHSGPGLWLMGGLLIAHFGRLLPSLFLDEDVQGSPERRLARRWSVVVGLMAIGVGFQIHEAH